MVLELINVTIHREGRSVFWVTSARVTSFADSRGGFQDAVFLDFKPRPGEASDQMSLYMQAWAVLPFSLLAAE